MFLEIKKLDLKRIIFDNDHSFIENL